VARATCSVSMDVTRMCSRCEMPRRGLEEFWVATDTQELLEEHPSRRVAVPGRWPGQLISPSVSIYLPGGEPAVRSRYGRERLVPIPTLQLGNRQGCGRRPRGARGWAGDRRVSFRASPGPSSALRLTDLGRKRRRSQRRRREASAPGCANGKRCSSQALACISRQIRGHGQTF
jgi:hypothetical protein